MWIDLHRHDALCIGFLSGVLIDFAAQLVRAPTVHTARLAGLASFDRAQALEEQHTASIPGAHVGNDAGDLVGGILIQPIHMPPEITVAMLAFDRLARLPLLFRHALEMA